MIYSKSFYLSKLRRLIGLLMSAVSAAALLFLLLSFVQAGGLAEGDILCVKPGGGGGCQASIGGALQLAGENDTIRVAAGQYVENIVISQTVNLQGGWNSDFTIRNINMFSSTIMPADNTLSVIQIQGIITDPEKIAPTLDGFTITGGRADLGSNHGGGVAIVDSNALVISNTIDNNVAFLLGGGIWVQRGAPLLQGNRIENNQTVGLGQEALGGGVQLENSAATLVQNLFTKNVVSGTESFGGGLAISGLGTADVLLDNNIFISNTAGLQPTGGFGGAITVMNGRAMMQDNQLTGNDATEGGGGVYLSGIAAGCCQVTSSGDRLQANHAAQGGAFFNEGQAFYLRNGLAISNTAGINGGAFMIDSGGMFSVTNSALIANIAAGSGGAIHSSGTISLTGTTLSGNSAAVMGGAIANFDAAHLLNTTIAGNQSPGGAGIMNASLVEVQNSLIAENDGDNCQGGLFSLGNNLEDGGTCAMGQMSDQNNTAPAMNNLANNGGDTPTYALTAASPAIDAGDNAACAAVDQRGAPRPVDGDGDGVAVCDIGAYEYGAPVAVVYMPVTAGN